MINYNSIDEYKFNKYGPSFTSKPDEVMAYINFIAWYDIPFPEAQPAESNTADGQALHTTTPA